MEALESMVLNTMKEQIAENEHGDMSPLIELHHQVEHLNAKLFATTMSNLHILHQYRSILQLVHSITPSETTNWETNNETSKPMKNTAKKELAIQVKSTDKQGSKDANQDDQNYKYEYKILKQKQDIQKYKQELNKMTQSFSNE